MRKRGGAKTSARSPRGRPPKSTSARSSSSSGADAALRRQLAAVLAWHDAHADFDRAVSGLPADARGRAPHGLPYSPWQLLEHLRLAQRDILDFCWDPKYVAPAWPDDYWPKRAAPPDAAAWDASVAAFRRDLAAAQRLAADSRIDLFAKIPHGSGQTYIRELLLILDHNAYHIGELVAVRRALGVWE